MSDSHTVCFERETDRNIRMKGNENYTESSSIRKRTAISKSVQTQIPKSSGETASTIFAKLYNRKGVMWCEWQKWHT